MFLSGFLLVVCASLSVSTPLATDYFFAEEVALEWSRGELAMISPFVMIHNHTPYFSLLHFLLVPFIWLGAVQNFARFLQVVFFAGTLGGTMLLIYRYFGSKASFYSGLMLLSSPAFVTESVIQVKPQSLVMLLFPPLIYFFLEGKRRNYVIASVVSIYTWSIASFAFVYGLLAYKVKERKWFLASIVFLLCCVRFFYYTIFYSDFGAMLTRWTDYVGKVSPKTLMTENPLYIFAYLGSPAIGFNLLIYQLLKWKTLSNTEKAVNVMILSSLPLTVIWIDRWLQCSSILFSITASAWLSRQKGFTYGFVFTLLLLSFVLWAVNYWAITFTGNWWSLGYNRWWEGEF